MRLILVAIPLFFCLVAIAVAEHHGGAPRQLVLTEEHHPFPPQQPNYGPAYGSITFIDTDSEDTIGGVLRMGRALDEDGQRINEEEAGITAYMVHWGLEVAEPGQGDDVGAGDHGGDCRGFRDTGYVVAKQVSELDEKPFIEWQIPTGTKVPEGAVYFVGHTLYGDIHNLGKCTQLVIQNSGG